MESLITGRKDKTLVHILETLRALESRFDRFESQWKEFLGPSTRQQSPVGTQMRLQSMRDDAAPTGPLLLPNNQDLKLAAMNWDFSTASLQSPSFMPYSNRIEARKLLAWPAIQTLLHDDLVQIPAWDGASEGGEKWLTRISMESESPLPVDEPLDFKLIGGSPSSNVWGARQVYLTKAMIDDLCEAFFRSFHSMCPILDRRHFYSDTLPEAYSSSFDQKDGCATLVLLVLALGAVAKEGVSGNPILEESTGRSTGIRGGTPERPPGLAFWNEANRRLGGVISTYDLNTIQCFILLSSVFTRLTILLNELTYRQIHSLYYSQCSRNKAWKLLSSGPGNACINTNHRRISGI
jgi:hypothetical protein